MMKVEAEKSAFPSRNMACETKAQAEFTLKLLKKRHTCNSLVAATPDQRQFSIAMMRQVGRGVCLHSAQALPGMAAPRCANVAARSAATSNATPSGSLPNASVPAGTTLTIMRPDDWHLHVRDGASMQSVVPHTAKHYGRAIIMPNLTPPVTTVQLVSV